jgi:RimJ/RimL family protein N-acetyltransferase
MFQNRNEKNIYKWCRQVGPISWQKHQNWFQKQENDPSIEMFVLENKGYEHRVVGVVGLTDIDYINSRAEFSCYIFKNHQGYGYAKLGLRSLFHYGFFDLGLNLIWGETFDENPAITLFKTHLGMKVDGRRRDFYYRNGKFIDAILLSLKKSEWGIS